MQLFVDIYTKFIPTTLKSLLNFVGLYPNTLESSVVYFDVWSKSAVCLHPIKAKADYLPDSKQRCFSAQNEATSILNDD